MSRVSLGIFLLIVAAILFFYVADVAKQGNLPDKVVDTYQDLSLDQPIDTAVEYLAYGFAGLGLLVLIWGMLNPTQ
jgi:hypothetical protein